MKQSGSVEEVRLEQKCRAQEAQVDFLALHGLCGDDMGDLFA